VKGNDALITFLMFEEDHTNVFPGTQRAGTALQPRRKGKSSIWLSHLNLLPV